MKRIEKIDEERSVWKSELGGIHLQYGNILAGLLAAVVGNILLCDATEFGREFHTNDFPKREAAGD